MDLTINIAIHPDSLNVLKEFITLIKAGGTPAATTKSERVPGLNGAVKIDKVEKPIQATGSETNEAVRLTIEQVRAAVQKKSTAGKKDQIKSLLGEFGVGKVTDLQPDQYQAFHEKIELL